MRFLLSLLFLVPGFGQQAAPQATPDQKTAPAKTDEKTESPAPAAEQWFSSDLDFGYRWLTDIRGNPQTYRSVINLGEGPKLFGLDFTIQDPKKRLFDRIDARGYGWGGDPYNTAHVDARKPGVYDFNFDYRNIAYFNALPSFANPFAPGGINERSFDTRRRMSEFGLDLFPGKRIVPYLVYGRNSGHGRGVTTFVQEGNEFAVPDLLRDSTDNYRGGVRLEFNHWHATLEQGSTHFKDDQQLFDIQPVAGNRTTPINGQFLTLNSVRAAYGISGDANYSRALVTATPFSWLSLSGQFLYSQPKTDVRYSDSATGNFVVLSQLLFFSGQTDVATGAARQPHVSGNAGFELRPFRRLRIVESWVTDRFHDAAFGAFTQQLLLKGAISTNTDFSDNRQIVNYNQNQIDALVDVTSKLTLRGGWRRVWGDATVRAGQLSQTGDVVSGQLARNVGLAGISVRPSEKLRVNLDYEAASSDRIYFRASLNDYHKVRARARYQASASLSLQANFTLLNNQNPAPDIQFDFQTRDNSVAVYWTPGGGKRFSMTGEYDRSTVRSSIGYLNLPFLNPAVSVYRENGHAASSAMDIGLPGYAGLTPKLTVGGSLFVSAGSRPSRYYQPLMRLSLPLEKHVNWNTEWRWYGFGEEFFLFEGFRTHTFMTGLRVTR